MKPIIKVENLSKQYRIARARRFIRLCGKRWPAWLNRLSWGGKTARAELANWCGR
ncbi:MAG: hypothetical protein WKF30_03115 [Pyrinomonadaceae bacterium]